jgi:hypothetical protein
MREIQRLISTVRARIPEANRKHFPEKKNRLRVEPTKTETPIQLEDSFPIIVWHNEVPNDFCLYTDVLDPTAAYVYIKAEGDELRATLVVSYEREDQEFSKPQLLDPSLDDNQIADHLIDLVVNASRRIRQPIALSA